MIERDVGLLINAIFFISCLWFVGIIILMYWGKTFKESKFWFLPKKGIEGRCSGCNQLAKNIKYNLCGRCRWKIPEGAE